LLPQFWTLYSLAQPSLGANISINRPPRNKAPDTPAVTTLTTALISGAAAAYRWPQLGPLLD
jgi:hypothetical protein